MRVDKLFNGLIIMNVHICARGISVYVCMFFFIITLHVEIKLHCFDWESKRKIF